MSGHLWRRVEKRELAAAKEAAGGPGRFVGAPRFWLRVAGMIAGADLTEAERGSLAAEPPAPARYNPDLIEAEMAALAPPAGHCLPPPPGPTP